MPAAAPLRAGVGSPRALRDDRETAAPRAHPAISLRRARRRAGGARRLGVHAAERRGVPGHLRHAGRRHHAVSGPCGGRDRAAGVGADRAGVERRSERDRAPVAHDLRPVGRRADVRVRHQRLLRAPGGAREAARRDAARRRHAVARSPLDADRRALSVHARRTELRLAATARDRGLDRRAEAAAGRRRDQHHAVRRDDQAVPDRGRSGCARQVRTVDQGHRAGRRLEQSERRRRAPRQPAAGARGARRRTHSIDRGHRERGRVRQRRGAGVRPRRRAGARRPRAALRHFRRRHRDRPRRRHRADAPRRESEPGAEGRPRGDRRAQRHHAAARRGDRADLRSHRSRRQHAAHRDAHARRGTRDRGRGPLPVPRQRARRGADRDHDSALAALRVRLHALQRHPRQPAQPRRNRLRHHRRRHARDGRAHRACAVAPPAASGRRRARRHPRRGAGGRAADLLLAPDHRVGVHSALHARARRAPAVHADGLHRLLCADRIDADRADAHSRPRDVSVPPHDEDLGQSGADVAGRALRARAGVVDRVSDARGRHRRRRRRGGGTSVAAPRLRVPAAAR